MSAENKVTVGNPFRKIYQKNKKDGDLGEDKVLPLVEKYFNVKIRKTSNYHEFDFVDNLGTYYEVKSRNNNYATYDTTMVGYNKIVYANNYLVGKPVYFIFNFLDGVYYYEYEQSKLNELEIRIGGRSDRGKEEYKKYCYIPIKKLIKIDIDNQNDGGFALPPSVALRVYNNKELIEEIQITDVIY